jgi:hypothetical protein
MLLNLSLQRGVSSDKFIIAMIKPLNKVYTIRYNQYDLRPKKSTEVSLYVIKAYLLKTFDKDDKEIAIFYDLAKAFSTVNCIFF